MDGRSVAKARDKWMLSKEGQKCQEGSAHSEYLWNRLESAFIAGVHACEKYHKVNDNV